ncbi:MAG: M48 family metalloprotease [Deltaproteobacteria bacterium]|nr:M48 family metalloprotease [Deltaproteobacteria bacterium]MBW2530435.1 M48 family metalloprotease [Deltaproteobacteria bacterium]
MLNQAKTVLLLGLLSALVVGFGALVAPGYLYLFGVLAILMNLGAYFFSDRIVLRMHGAAEIGERELPWLHADVAELAAKAGIPKPRVFLIREAQPNAFATGRNPEHGVVAVTEGIVALLSRRELRGVLAHEIAHIKNRDILIASVAAMLSSMVTYAAQAFGMSSLFGGSQTDEEGGGASGLLLALLAPIGATFVQLAISRSREYVADETGARLTGDPEALASALVKLERGAEQLEMDAQPATASLFIVNPLFGQGGMSRWFSTHPETDERVRRLLALRAELPSPPEARMAEDRMRRIFVGYR